jgi:LasA protease
MNHFPSHTGKVLALFLIFGMILSACASDLWGTNDPYQTPTSNVNDTAPVNSISTKTPIHSPIISPFPLSTSESTPTSLIPTYTPTITQIGSSAGTTVLYTAQSGDSLYVVANHFGVKITEISSPLPLSTTGFINPGTLLFLPANQSPNPTTPSQHIFPDSEIVDSPSAVDFDIETYINLNAGRLSTYTEWMSTVGTLTGAEGVNRISLDSSINPRLLLALIQYYTGWVQGQSIPGLDEECLFGYKDPANTTLYQQLRLVIQDLLKGYYGWRAGNLDQLTFPDGTTLRIAPDLNAGSVALQYFFSRHYNYDDWLRVINPDTGFLSLYRSMFGNYLDDANERGPLFPSNLIQPTFTLPFEIGALWAFTGGPHPAWEAESALGALDFAPAADVSGCAESNAWVVAIAPGKIVRSESSYVVLDLDGDGYEQTGWVVIYQHIGTKNRIKSGIWVNAGDRIGHPSCEGGMATGTNLHIARKYNGEWVAAGGPLPFGLSGWTAHSGNAPYLGTLTKDDTTITANQTGIRESQIIRQPGE